MAEANVIAGPQVGPSPAVIGRVLGAAALVAIPISFVAYWFTHLVDNAQEALWDHLPDALGFDVAPWWWPLPLMLVGGALLAAVLLYIPGRAGSPPANGFEFAGLSPSIVVPVLLGALACLPFGAVLGPEAPLTVLGAGGALWIARTMRIAPTGQTEALVTLAGAGAAVSTILGNPLVAVVFVVEAAAITGAPIIAATLPSMLAIGVGSIVFIGLGSFSGLDEASLTAPPFKGDVSLDAPDLAYAIGIGIVAGVVMTILFMVGHRFARVAAASSGGRLASFTVAAAVFVGACAASYGAITGRSPQEIASSGTATMGVMLANPGVWAVGTLIAVLIFKAIGYMVSLGALRGGPIFPGVFLGVALGVLVAPLPGLGLAAAVSAGVAGFTGAGLRMPLSAAALTVLMFGSSAPDQVPTIIIAAVTGFLIRTVADRRFSRAEAEAPPIQQPTAASA